MPTKELAREVNNLDRLPPQNLEAEQAVLGSMLLEEDAVVRATELLQPEVFYKESHRQLFEAIRTLYQKNTPVDLVTLTDILKNKNQLDSVGGADYLTGLVSSVPTAANVDYYCGIVREKYILRTLIQVSTSIAADCYTEANPPDLLLDQAESKIFEIASHRAKRDAVSMKEIIKDSIEQIDALYQRKGGLTGLTTGFSDLDKELAGLQRADLVIVAGRPAMGKSSFALCVAEAAAMQANKGVAIFSLEMSKENVVQRMLCSYARINAHAVRSGMLSAKDWPKLTDAAGRLSEAPIFVDDTPGVSILELRAKARRLKARNDIGLVVVDYLQLMDAPSSESRQQEISVISRGLKGLARELDIPVIALSQLSRAAERRDSFRPRLSDLRESGSIEQDADVVLMLFREEYYNPTEENKGVAEAIIAKQRNGPTGTVKLAFLNDYTRFENLARV